MFKNEKEAFVQETETVIAPSVRVEGDFVSDGNIRIEGTVAGSVKTKQDLVVGKDAEITANVTARNAVIAGTLHGNLKVIEALELASTARVFGDLEAKVLTVAPGASIDGRLEIGVEHKAPAIAPAAAHDEAPAAKPETRARSAREKKIEEILQQ